jgi:hypothetical protein
MLRANVNLLALTVSGAALKMASQPLSAAHMSTFRPNISRMLLSTNPSRIVDITNDQELKRGVTTSGEKSQYEEKTKTTVQKAMEKIEENVAGAQNNSNQKTSRRTSQMGTSGNTMVQQKSSKDEPVDSQNIQPGTQHLKGTNDNFNDDPAISIGELQDKMRGAKDTAKATAKAVATPIPEAVSQPLEHAAKDLKNMVKDAVKATPLHDMGHAVKVKAKEMMTGEREKEKPDETKSEVRTKGWEKQKQQQGGGR